MAVTVYRKTSLTGGLAADLDSIDGALLLDGDVALVTESGVLYVYVLDDDSGVGESSPRIIAPDVNPGTKRWLLQQTNADGALLKGGTNTLNITNGTASLDVAAGAAVNVDHNLTTGGACTVGGAVSNATLPAFLVRPTNDAANTNITGDGTDAMVAWGTEIKDQAGNFASSQFTAPVAGLYQLSASVYLSGFTAGTHTVTNNRIVTSNRDYVLSGEANTYNAKMVIDSWATTGSILVDMDAGDTASVYVAAIGGTKIVSVTGSTPCSYFSGFLVC